MKIPDENSLHKDLMMKVHGFRGSNSALTGSQSGDQYAAIDQTPGRMRTHLG